MENNWARKRPQPATDIISSRYHQSQAGIAGQVYFRIISLPGISKLPQDIRANKAIWARCLFRGMVTLLVGQDAAGVLGDAVLGHAPQPWSDPSKAPTSSKPYGCICGCEGWAKGIRKLEDEVNSRAQKKTGRLMAGTQPKTKVKMEMLII